MTQIQQTWTQHEEPFSKVVASITDWDAASPCEGWSARDVLHHVMETERDFLGKQGHELLAAATVEDPAAAWREHNQAVTDLLGDQSVADKQFDGYFGPTTVGETLARFYGFDLRVHRWDLARSQGADEQFTDAELDEIDSAVDGFGDHAYVPGIFADPVKVPEDADRTTKVLARTGRKV